MIKSILKKLLPRNVKRRLLPLYYLFYRHISYSQEGEDMVLKKIFETDSSGFYIDIGAHHPKRFSNTYYFYKRGWKGINIDAMPGSMKLFNLIRSRDINLEIPVSNEKKILKYYVFNEPALNGFSKELSENRDGEDTQFKVIKTLQLETSRLDEILEKYVPKNQKISFLSIDVEGLDLEVLKSNNWLTYRPQYILVEIYNIELERLHECEIYNFLKSKNYKLVSKCVYTCIFQAN